MGIFSKGVRQSQAGQAKSYNSALEKYQQKCGHPFPEDQNKTLHDKITNDKKDFDGDLTTENLLEIMLGVVPCRDPEEKNRRIKH